MDKKRKHYIFDSLLGVGLLSVLTTVASVKVYFATNLDLMERISILILIWLFVAYFIFQAVRYYKKIKD
jgi:hypothetical protein